MGGGGVCIQGCLHTGWSASQGSASGRVCIWEGLHLGGSASGRVCIWEGLHLGGSASRGVCIQGGLHWGVCIHGVGRPPIWYYGIGQWAGSTHPTGMHYFWQNFSSSLYITDNLSHTMCVETYKLSIYGTIYTSEVNGSIENLNGALANGYARSRQRLKGAFRYWPVLLTLSIGSFSSAVSGNGYAGSTLN